MPAEKTMFGIKQGPMRDGTDRTESASSDSSQVPSDTEPEPEPKKAHKVQCEDARSGTVTVPENSISGLSWLDHALSWFGLRASGCIRTDLEDALEAKVESEGFSVRERAMLRSVLGFHRTRVQDVMVPRADIIAVSERTEIGALLRIFQTAGHSRLPVHGETLDDPRGMVHIRDFLDYLVARAESGDIQVGPGHCAGSRIAPDMREKATRRGSEDGGAQGDRATGDLAIDGIVPGEIVLGDIDLSTSLADTGILRPVLFSPPSMPAVELLSRMQVTRTHMALVIDEYGGTDGLVSIEDLVELIVGDIEDEHDEDRSCMIEKAGPDTFLVDARADLASVSAAISARLSGDDGSHEVDTIGGLVVMLAGRVPSRGEILEGPHGILFEIVDSDPKRLKRIMNHSRRDGIPSSEIFEKGNGTAGRP